ncbi:hypothetical protein HS7_10300 [Sulfolobales archaeon HS-7]|nr:hypothetical protein HS7_10300 [Sulfolobales archaeon HS-7]
MKVIKYYVTVKKENKEEKLTFRHKKNLREFIRNRGITCEEREENGNIAYTCDEGVTVEVEIKRFKKESKEKKEKSKEKPVEEKKTTGEGGKSS